ncbi:MAG: Protein of unknown function (DUF2611) [Rhodobacteraceae bacterium HLUCCO18]|nr:MAG: Protein of unknown function (DUF2611) [Rhodobacteraceae bacterium HLUCCO18]
MDTSFLIPALLSLGTIGAVIVLAYWSRKSTIERMEDDNAPKSNLAKDGPDHGDPDRR